MLQARNWLLLSYLALVFAARTNVMAQSRSPFYSREISLVADNDILAFQDYYYTAGQDFLYRRLLRSDATFHRLFKPASGGDSSKVILQYRYGVKIFTPYDISASEARKLDRPYAGWNYGDVTFSNFPSSRSGNQYQVQVGLVGAASGMEELQKWIHGFTNFSLPKGWSNQIENEPIVNLAYSRFQNLRLGTDVDLVSQSSVQLGTGSNRISQELALRLMQFNPINNSAFTDSRLSWDTRPVGRKREIEFFIFAAAGVNYVLSNVFIEGSIFSTSRGPVNAKVEPWLFHSRIGFMVSKHDISWSLIFHELSNEVVGGRSHAYASMALAVRF